MDDFDAVFEGDLVEDFDADEATTFLSDDFDALPVRREDWRD